METAGVGLAIVGTCELCLKYEEVPEQLRQIDR